MKQILILIIIIISVSYSYSQDTTVIQTLTYDSITTRRGFWEFPDTTHQYRKILMQHTLKCDAATTQDGYACGEWDYLTYTNIYEHTGVLDSNLAEHAQYVVGVQTPDSFLYGLGTFNIFHQQHFTINYDSTISENVYNIGTGTDSIDFGDATDAHSQFYWADSVLTQSGMLAGEITGIKLNFQSVGTLINNVSIKLKAANTYNATIFNTDGYTEVYNQDAYISSSSWTDFNFITPFNWDGSSGIIIDISYSNSSAGISSLLVGDLLPYQTALYTEGSDNYISIDGSNYVSVPVDSMASLITDEITISFWQFGNPTVQPQSDYIFEARNANDKRVFGSHLPWSNSRVYWDCGNSGGNSYDRIDKAANFSDFAGKWNHWAFTKNVQTGIMKIYLNGQLWHSGSGKTRTIIGITKFNIGASAIGNGFYSGYINEFTVWNKALSEADIHDWMYKSIDNTHPSFGNLICYYPFDDGDL